MEEDFNQLKALTEVVKDSISLKENESSKKLMYFIKRSLRQMGLENEIDESEILIQAYLRARDKILSGIAISNYPSYLSRVAYFVILDESKHRTRRKRLSQRLSSVDSTSELSQEGSFSERVSEEVIESLWTSFESLSLKDREILFLRIVQGLSWKEIGFLMVRDGREKRGGSSLEAKLRKQGERALVKLRKQISSANISDF